MMRLIKPDHIVLSEHLKLARYHAQKALFLIVKRPGRRERLMKKLEKIMELTREVSRELIERRDFEKLSLIELEDLYFEKIKPMDQ